MTTRTQERSRRHAASIVFERSGCRRMIVGTTLLLLVAAVAASATEDGAVLKSWTLYHTSYNNNNNNNDNEAMEPRARIVLHATQPTTAADTAGLELKWEPITPVGVVTQEEEETKDTAASKETDTAVSVSFSTQQVKTMLESGWYQLKLVPDDDDDKELSSILTSIPSCLLRRANFRDEVLLTLGPDGKAMSLTYKPLVSPLAPTSCELYMDDLVKEENENNEAKQFTFDSKLSWETSQVGMTLRTVLPSSKPPPGLQFQRATKGAGAKGVGGEGGGLGPDGEPIDGDKQLPPVDNSPLGFFKRYWYIIAPLLLMNLLGPDSAAAPPPGADAPPAAAAGASAVAAAGAAAGGSVAAGGRNQQRRGKRD